MIWEIRRIVFNLCSTADVIIRLAQPLDDNIQQEQENRGSLLAVRSSRIAITESRFFAPGYQLLALLF